jgi:GTPase SAR1 family protein
MNSELTRRYAQPVPVSAATALHYRQYRNSSSVASSLGSIPDPSDLLNIKADLEALLPITEKRIRNLQRDLANVKKNIRVRELSMFCLFFFVLVADIPPFVAEDEQRQLDQQQQIQLQQQKRQQEHEHQQQQHVKKSGKSASPAFLEKMQIKQETTGSVYFF